MQQSYETYLNIIKNICTDSDAPLPVSAEDAPNVARLAEDHCTIPFVLSGFRGSALYPSMLQRTKSMMLNYYQIEQFTRRTITFLKEHGISCILLKGISLAAYYPIPEYRKLGDLDLYLTESSDLNKACKVLEENGYIDEHELSDHHVTYRYTFPRTGRSFTLELHYRVVGIYQYNRANQIIDNVFSPTKLIPDTQVINGWIYAVLPPTEYTFYMIHHMLKHYLYSGFGIRLLCDFVFYIMHHEKEIRFDQIHKWCEESRISHLYEIVLETCRIYLGLPAAIDPDIHYSSKDCETFISRILKNGDMGADVSSKLVASTSYRNINLFTYFREGHLQMKVRFPRASHIPIIWPVLWGLSFFYFWKNTYTVRNTTFHKTIQDFHKSNQKTKLIRIFENSDS